MNDFRVFRDRVDAGRQLARLLEAYRDERPVVVALPRGGVPVGVEVARSLGVPLDVIVVRKVGAPGRPELGLGAVAEGGVQVLDPTILWHLGLDEDLIRPRIEQEMAEVARRVRRYRGDRPRVALRDRTVIVVDDGIATGGTMRAAIQVIRQEGAAKVVVAVPVAGPESVAKISAEADEVVCVEVSSMIWAIGLAYHDFEQVSDEEVRSLLEQASEARGVEASPAAGEEAAGDEVAVLDEVAVRIPMDDVILDGDLTKPPRARGLVLFAHGSGSGRKSPRNRQVARHFHNAGLATLLVDLLSKEEAERDARTAELRFDMDLLIHRMVGIVDWAATRHTLGPLPKACFGSSTGAAAALAAAAERPKQIAAVVSRGGRIDLARRWLARVRAPCLFIVGEQDAAILSLHAQLLDEIAGHTRVVVVRGAGHLFEEPGALEEVARRATDFLRQQLRPPAEARP